MKKIFVIVGLLLCIGLPISAVSQTVNASLSGSVGDSTGALIPGVTVTATNTLTGVIATIVTNESGAYSLPSLQPGIYRVSAQLPGFQTHSYNNVSLGLSDQLRLNFTLNVASVATSVEVSVDASSLLATSSSSVGEVLPEYRIRDLPLVGGDVLNLIQILPGVVGENFAGVNQMSVNTVRDGLSVSDGRQNTGVFGTTVINPDLVGEIRLILAPVDAELGRGNGQVQIQTRSGTNRFTGSAVWNIRNSSLNPNTWANNRNVSPQTGEWSPTVPNWYNQHQYTLSFGGPIIRNKTFFFALWDQQLDYRRELVNASVMTDAARQGIFRYFEGWQNGNAQATTNATGTSPSRASVDFAGNPLFSATPPSTLRCFSVFGNIKADGSPFTTADCPGGSIVTPAGVSFWDQNRPQLDTTGMIRKFLDLMPKANYFGGTLGDGLNLATHRYVRTRNGNSGPNVTIGNDQNTNRKQINVKIDHNFSATHKLSAGWSHERNATFSDTPTWPDGVSHKSFRNPTVLTLNFISTLAPSLLNEARFGLRYMNAGANAAWEEQYGNEEVQRRVLEYTLKGGSSALPMVKGQDYFALLSPGAGNFAFGGNLNGLMNTNPAQYNGNKTPFYDYADTLSWTRGVHAFKFGGDLRFTESNAYNSVPIMPYPRILGGAGGNTSPLANATNTPALPNFVPNARTNAANMLYFLAGSVNDAQMLYWIDDFGDVQNGQWEDVQTLGRKWRDVKQNEFAFFAKDDWKVTRNMTLNLGLRYEIYASPYIGSGFTSTAKDLGAGLFGMGRFGDDLFSNWLQPGSVFLTGYGSNVAAASALRCVQGVSQSSLLPASSCDPAKLTTIEFVGPKTPNPEKTAIPKDYRNFGPAVGFAWQVPWFGAGRTTVRGGYQMTFGGSGRMVGGAGPADRPFTTETLLGAAPGAISSAALVLGDFNGQYLDLSRVADLVPVRPTTPVVPGGQIAVYDRAATFSVYDPQYVTPYTQNFTLSVTRNLRPNMTADFRYIGTVSKKQEGWLNPNANNAPYNKELFDALEITRAGGNAVLFDEMFAGLDFDGAGGLPAVGSLSNGAPVRGSAQLRRHPNLNANLANGNYVGVATTLNTLNTANVTGLQNLPANLTGVNGRVLRNGCDRLANGVTSVPTRCFPENYLVINPQIGDTVYRTGSGSSNYHSLQSQFTLRPTQGFSFQGTYTWSKNLGIPGSGYTDPSNRNADYTYTSNHRAHDFRTNSSFELPIGPNKLLLPNASGWVARLIERWQIGTIFNLTSGGRASIGAQSMLYANGVPDIVGPFDLDSGKVSWGHPTANASISDGRYFGSTTFIKVPDPQCDKVSSALEVAGTASLQSLCTLDAVAIRNSDGTAGPIVLQNPLPGRRGTLGRAVIELPHTWSFDANMSKTFRLGEARSVQVRMDATNILNHPNLNAPDLNINGGNPFGTITSKGTDTRSFQGQVRLSF